MKKCIAFHSYKGGTGKSTISSNISVLLVQRGYNVLLIDMDVYAPTLQTYFSQEPNYWINNFLFNTAEFESVIYDLTRKISQLSSTKDVKKEWGKLFVSFSNSSKEEITKLDGALRNDASKLELLRKFILIKEEMAYEKNIDYIIIDTSPGIRYWSINSLAIADMILLSLKMDSIDIEGTKKMANEIYSAFTKLGTKSYLLFNRAAGYCLPPNLIQETSYAPEANYALVLNEQSSITEKFKKDVDMEIIGNIPCYCDIQFDNKEFLTVLKHPYHPFTHLLNDLVNKIEKL
ncbi:MAG TPA: AAA family ATPase [Nitrososphaeraceae archaeon]|jgi:MinD-like ATPase involved in chromosome partitioning or flagellar assembly|nr:AAA family ATPase [Nitrososphaeraceae archaeon]HJT86049.1 AAA family ATPase [Nitrososphaeraceae archaeon]